MDKEMKVTVSPGDVENYTMRVVAENRHVDIFTYGDIREPGSRVKVVFYNLSHSDLLQLGQDIMAEAGELIVEKAK